MNQKILIPVSIIIAGILVAGAVFYSNRQPGTAKPVAEGPAKIAVEAVNEEDWIRGEVNAKLTFIEFSDTECPFCKGFHETMNEIVSERNGEDVAWVYRHLPLTQIHSKAGIEAVALECAGELGGQDAFWNYTNQVYAETPSNNGLNLDRLPEIAEEQGLNRVSFEECLNNRDMQEKVENDLDDATKSAEHLSGLGTPYTILVSQTEFNEQTINALLEINQRYARAGKDLVVISEDNFRASISGNIPKENLDAVIDAQLGN